MSATSASETARVRAVSFDFDNTLLLSEACKMNTMREVCEAYEGGAEILASVPRDARSAPPGVSVTRHTIFRDVARILVARGAATPDDGADALGERLCAQFTTTLEQRLLKADEVPGASRLLEHLNAHNVPCYVNTATPQGPVESLVGAMGWRRHFRAVLGAPAFKVDNLAAALAAEGLDSPALLVHVGDGDNDCKAARDFGCPFVGVVLADEVGDVGVVGTGRAGEPAATAAAAGSGGDFSGPCHAVVADMDAASVVLCELLGVPPPSGSS